MRNADPEAGKRSPAPGGPVGRGRHALAGMLVIAAAGLGQVAANDRPVASTHDHGARSAHMVPLFPSAADGVRQGFVRVINHSDDAGEVRIDAIDDAGDRFGPLMLSVESGQTVHFNSTHLENGDPGKGWSTGTGPGRGDWRLRLSSDLDVEVLSYIRLLGSGFVTSMHDTAPGIDNDHDSHDEHDHDDDDGHSDDDGDADHAYRVAIFNPGSNTAQASRLRVINAGDESTEVTVSGIDDRGHAATGAVTLSVAAGAARTVSARELETGGDGLEGRLGDGAGKWQLTVRSHEPVAVLSLLQSPTGHLTNLSTLPARADGGVPLFPAANDAFGRQGFVRVINHASTAGAVEIHAFDDSGAEFGPVTLSLDAGETAHFNSDDLELGNAGKGLPDGVGSGAGDWRLALKSDLDIEVLAYIRTTRDGFLTSMHDTVPTRASRHRVVFFNPASNPDLTSWLRLVNPGDDSAAIAITGTDDRGESPGGPVALALPGGAAITLTSADLEQGAAGIVGALGDGAGKWRLDVDSDAPIIAMSLLSSTAGYLTNLSAAPARAAGRELAAEFFRASISAPIVQARCITCHVAGGLSGTSRLVFVPASEHGHESINFDVFHDFLAADDHDGHDHEGLDHVALVLAKIQGLESHGGGVQIEAGTEDFRNMERFLELLRAAVDAVDAGDHDDDHDHDHD